MKRILFPALVLCAALASGCKTEPNNNNANQNANQAANQNGANTNQNVIGNVNSGSLTRDPKNKAVLISVSEGDSGKEISVSPSTIYLSKGKGQKLRFIVYDNLDSDLKEVKIEFKSAAGDPMDGSYTFGGVASGTDEHSNSRGIKAGAANGAYKYTITVTVDGLATPVVLDPEVEIGN